MIKFLKKLLGSAHDSPPPVQASEPVAAVVEASEDLVDPFKCGLLDNNIAGWYRAEPGKDPEVYPGVPVSADDIVLDVGCGDGGTINFCAQYGADIIFADIDADKVAAKEQNLRASNAKSVRAIVSDANPLPLDDHSATRIISMEVMEHVDEPKQFLAELYRVGKPGAIYLISVPDAAAEEMQIGFAAPAYFEKPNHINIFQREEFQALVQESGLDIVSIDYQGFYWSVWWMFFWGTGQELSPPWNELIHSWAKTWDILLNTPRGLEVKQRLDQALPKTQILVATKPRNRSRTLR